MFKKHLLTLIVLLAFSTPSFAFDACGNQAREDYKPLEKTYTNGLLFRISKCGVVDSYMFGTYHSDDERVWNNAQVAISYMSNSSVAVFEVTNGNDPSVIQSAMYFKDDSTDNLQTMLGDQDFNDLYSAFQNIQPMPVEALKRMRPWAASVLLQMPKDSSGKGMLDDRLKEIALQKKIRMAPLESLGEQFEVFTSLSNTEQITMLRESLKGLSQLNMLSQQIDQAYLAQDIRMLGQLADASFRMMVDMNLKEKLIKNLITTRNENMANRVIPYVDQGNAFIAIGALHLMGNGGVLNELEKQGYYITPVL
jgi:uncharacterized protein YbaP (TraB family)